VYWRDHTKKGKELEGEVGWQEVLPVFLVRG